jgi:hypothetical protein
MQPAAKEAGLIIKRTKTKYMESSKNRTNGLRNITLNGQPHEGISSFKYLGSMVAYNNDVMVYIKEKIAAGNRCLRALDNVLKAKYITKKIKIRIYKTIIKPVVTYGSEVWTITDRIASILMTWERKILRKIYYTKCENGVWRIRINLELQNIYKDTNIISDIKTRRCG